MYEKMEKVLIKRQCPNCSGSVKSQVAPHWFQLAGNKSALTAPFIQHYKINSQDGLWEQNREVVTCVQCGTIYEWKFEICPNRTPKPKEVEQNE